MLNKLLFIISFVFLSLHVFSSHSYEIISLDSLNNELSKSKTITDTINVYFKLSAYYVNYDIKKAEYYANEIVHLSESINYQKGIADGYYSLARIFHNSHYDISFNFIQKALAIYEESDDKFQIAKSLNLISIIKGNLGEYNSALEYSHTILEISLEIGDSTLYAMVLNNIGTYYSDLKNDSLAQEYYIKAAEVNQKTGHKRFLSINYGNICITKREDNHIKEAREYYNKSYALKQEIDDVEGFGWLYETYAKILEDEKKYDSALVFYHKSLKICKQFDNKNQLEITLDNLQKLHDQKGNIDSAYFWLKELITLRDSVYDKEKTKSIYLHEINLEHKAEQEFSTLKHRAQIFKMTLVILVLCIIILITAFIIYLINLNRRKFQEENKRSVKEKEKLEKELQLKNQELATYVMNLVNKNQLVNNVIAKLESQMNQFTPENRRYINSISSELSASLNKEIWKEFEVRFNQVHPDFQNKILNKYPDLTPNELKICSFLRMNMASKEISQITYQSVQSIEKARSRLRKKLLLTNTETTLVYFLSKF